MKGRKPQPIEDRIRTGNQQHEPMPEPMLVAGRPNPDELPEPPDHLPEDAKRLWRSDVWKLIEVGVVDRVDFPALEGLCIAYARACQAGRVVNKVGHFTHGSQGQPIQHPALRIERESWARFYAMAEHFALTPVARTRLGLAELHRRSLRSEIEDNLGTVNLSVVDADDLDDLPE